MAINFKEKITMKFTPGQLDRIIIALLNKGYNKKFASNVKRLIDIFVPNTYNNDIEKQSRIHLILKIVDIILNNNIIDKNNILNFLDFDGKFSDECNIILNNLYEEDLTDNELDKLDQIISSQLRYSAIENKASELINELTNLTTENYDSLDDQINILSKELEIINKDIKDARESISDSKTDLSLSSDTFINFLGSVINKQRNPASKIKTGIQYMNNMLNGGFERGRLYTACGVAKRMEIWLKIKGPY